MRESWRRHLPWLGPAMLVVQALLVLAAAGGEVLPAPPDVSTFPRRIGTWRMVSDSEIPQAIGAALGADRLLSRYYEKTVAPGGNVEMLVAWFQSQRGGARQPHSPKVCLPGAGWTPMEARDVALATPAGSITVNRFVVSNGRQKAVVLYWYQTPRRAIAGEWEAKYWLIVDALWTHRTDAALVRVTTLLHPLTQDHAAGAAEEFASLLYSSLADFLPR